MPVFSPRTFTLPDGIDIFFADSGPPPNSTDYTTLIVLHGSAFLGDIFENLHDLAHGYNLRTVVWNRRDYPGSTKYTDAELEDLASGRKIFLDRLAIQVGHFVEQLIEKEHIPKISADRKNGGVAIMGWSMGSATAMPLFSDPSLLSPELYTLLEAYVKDLILYDSPYLSFGWYDLPADEKMYHVWQDPDYKTTEEIYQNFRIWASSYFDHPVVASGSINGLDNRKRTNQATVDSWTPEQIDRFYYEPAGVRSEFKMYVPPMQHTLLNLANRVLFDENLAQSFFPKVPVTYIGGTSSNWHCVWAAMELKRHCKEHIDKGEKIRPVRFLSVEGGNHFMHWDQPKEFMDAVQQTIRG